MHNNLILNIMDKFYLIQSALVRIKVFKFINGVVNELYRNTVKVPVGVSFSYDNMADALRWLYPGCTIQYSL